MPGRWLWFRLLGTGLWCEIVRLLAATTFLAAGGRGGHQYGFSFPNFYRRFDVPVV